MNGMGDRGDADNDEETESCIDTVSIPDDELNYISDVDTQGEEEICQEEGLNGNCDADYISDAEQGWHSSTGILHDLFYQSRRKHFSSTTSNTSNQ